MSGFIYFVACLPMNAVKIGYSQNPVSRVREMQTGCPAPLKLYATVPATMEEERRLHAAFMPLHIHGEWFRFEAKLHDMACYLSGNADRESFLGALHDVLMQGLWNPYKTLSEDDYLATGDWEPFRKELWAAFGPWEE
jgi:hypothetical protein